MNLIKGLGVVGNYSLFALSKDCERFLMEVEESADLGMKLFTSASYRSVITTTVRHNYILRGTHDEV